MRLVLAVSLFLTGVVAVARAEGPGCTATGGEPSVVSTPGPYGTLPGEIVTLRSAFDGETIQIGVVRPDVPAGVRAPVIALASPYFFGGLGGDLRPCN